MEFDIWFIGTTSHECPLSSFPRLKKATRTEKERKSLKIKTFSFHLKISGTDLWINADRWRD